MIEIIDDVPYEEAMRAIANRKYHMIVDRGLATSAFGSSGSRLTNIVFLPYFFVAGAIVAIFYSWVLAIACLALAFLSFKLLRNVAIGWVRRRAVRDPALYEIFARNRVVWFTPVKLP
ncbi:hypothetical protein [Novosphingobium soli]|uniref:Uncharacterized protein n=1 Tax=Novosphingobium soli TaxID=574956 RepID=A0ABV6CVH4_9SPHN